MTTTSTIECASTTCAGNLGNTTIESLGTSAVENLCMTSSGDETAISAGMMTSSTIECASTTCAGNLGDATIESLGTPTASIGKQGDATMESAGTTTTGKPGTTTTRGFARLGSWVKHAIVACVAVVFLIPAAIGLKIHHRRRVLGVNFNVVWKHGLLREF